MAATARYVKCCTMSLTGVLDILKRYEEVFDLEPDPLGGWQVRLAATAPGVLAMLPASENPAAMVDSIVPMEAMLPERMENPATSRDKMQALRIEIMHAISRRGGKSPVQELGQEPRVQRHKQGLHQAKKLLDFIKLFPANFRIASDDSPVAPQMVIELASFDVNDKEMIDVSILKAHQAALGPGRSSYGSSQGGSRSGGSSFNSRGSSSRPSYDQYRDRRDDNRDGRAYMNPPPSAAPTWRDAAAAAVAHAQAQAHAYAYAAAAAGHTYPQPHTGHQFPSHAYAAAPSAGPSYL